MIHNNYQLMVSVADIEVIVADSKVIGDRIYCIGDSLLLTKKCTYETLNWSTDCIHEL